MSKIQWFLAIGVAVILAINLAMIWKARAKWLPAGALDLPDDGGATGGSA